jgi:SAM-dependent methyltransferase
MILFVLTIFLSATLLFLVQPMVGKMLLPLAGGSSAVWNTCMVTFQAGLLLGYGYSHLVTTRLGLKAQVGVHAALALVTISALPFVAPTEAPPTESTLGLTVWLIRTIVGTVGLPFFVVSTTGPLIQRWFSRTDHPRAGDPYFLYAASNIGSALGLLGYPFLLESNWNLAGQSFFWAAGYFVLAVMLVACGVSAIRSRARAEVVAAESERAESVSWGRRGVWVLLAAVPSSLMIGVTQHIATDLASVPLLWVIPLFLYLMTFTLAFSPRVPMPRWALSWLTLIFVLVDGMIIMTGLHKPLVLIVSIHLVTFVLAALMCHRRLADDRPGTARLTEFFFWIAVGGVVGGVFNGLVAPLAFTLVYEYPVALAACLLLRPGRTGGSVIASLDSWRGRASAFAEGRVGIAVAFFAAAAALGIVWGVGTAVKAAGADQVYVEGSRAVAAVGFCGVLAVLVRRPIVVALPFLAAVVAGQTLGKRSWGDATIALERSFFGVHHVYVTSARRDDGTVDPTKPVVHKLLHGTTLHGAQLFGPMERMRNDGTRFVMESRVFPTTYYHQRGPVGDIFRHAGNTPARRAALESVTAGFLEAARGSTLSDAGNPMMAAGMIAGWPAAAQRVGDAGRVGSPVTRVAVVGLGGGGIATYAKPGDHYTFYEIDPVVRDLATDPKVFSFVADARERGARVDIVLGDGRLSLAAEPDGTFGLIILDAFSSDSIPVHLLTREALEKYFSKLRPDGVIAFHVSNRYFDLTPVLYGHAKELGTTAYISEANATKDEASPRGVTPSRENVEFMSASSWVVFGKDRAVLANFAGDTPWWGPLQPGKGTRGGPIPEWTDDFSDVLSVFRGWGN